MTITVLVVDDNADDREILSRAFREVVDVEVVTAISTAMALEWAFEHTEVRDLLVVTDLKMPDDDGLALIAAFRRSYRAAPVILVMSTSDRPVDIERAYATGANAYHIKPMGYFETVELCQSIIAYWRNVSARPAASMSLVEAR